MQGAEKHGHSTDALDPCNGHIHVYTVSLSRDIRRGDTFPPMLVSKCQRGVLETPLVCPASLSNATILLVVSYEHFNIEPGDRSADLWSPASEELHEGIASALQWKLEAKLWCFFLRLVGLFSWE